MTDGELYAKHADELVQFATVLVGPSAAEDVVAEAVTRAMSSAKWAAVHNRRAYLYRATLNQARQVHRADSRRVRRERKAAVDECVDGHPLRIEVADALGRLNGRQRAIVFFTYWSDLNAAEVAALIGTSARTVQRDLGRARRRLEVLLRD